MKTVPPSRASLALRIRLAALALLSATLFAGQARADGIPEPSLVLYGVVTDPHAGNQRITYGPIVWVFQPLDGSPSITVSGVLTNINDQFCYILRVPVETQLPGIPVSTGALQLASSPTTYSRSQVTVQGLLATFVQPSQTNLTLFSTDRGKIERIDLLADVSGIGLLPDAWQIQWFGHTGVDPYDDPDHDGMNNYQEYRAGTSPLDGQSRFQIVRVRPDPTGAFVDWSSVSGKYYTVQRSSTLLDGFADLQIHIPASAPLNTFHDTSSAGLAPFFYRIRVE